MVPGVKVRNAGMADIEAKQIWDAFLKDGNPDTKQRLIEIQRHRLAFDELGAQLEKAESPEQAAEAYRDAGNTTAELRVLTAQHDGALLERYCQLLMARPAAMIAAIGRERKADAANAMVNYVIVHGTAAQAQQAIAARGTKMGPLWTKAYTGLSGMYFGTNARLSFTDILGDMTVGPRIGVAVDRKQKLAGDLWFYYAGRFGEYTKSDDFLPAIVEATPGRSDAYFILAEVTGSTEDYHHALELNASRADVHDRLAAIAAKSGQRDEAVAEWRLAIGALTEMMNRSRVPQKYWTDFSDVLRHIAEAKAMPALRDDLDKILRLYIRRNGAFQIEGLMEALGDVAWMADLSRSAADPVQFLSALIEQPWVPEAQRDVLYRKIVEHAQAAVGSSFGDQRVTAQNQAWQWQMTWAEWLLGRGENRRAAEIVNSVPDETRWLELRLKVADRTGNLKDLLARFQGPIGDLRNSMEIEGVREFVYEHELRAGSLEAVNFLGLAEIRLGHNDVAAAMTLLRRMALVSGQPYSGLDPAAALLEKTGHPTEAAEFLETLVKAEPWNWDARGRLAALRSSVAELAVVAKSPDAPYATRVAAARAIKRLKGPALDGTDAELIALSTQVTDFEKPYWVAARIEAGAEKSLAEAVAIDPTIPKLPLLRAALAAKHDAYAVGIAREMSPYFFENAAQGFLNGEPAADRAAVAFDLGAAEERLGDLRAAMSLYDASQKTLPKDATRKALAAARRRIELNATNEARRPVVTDNLEQDRLVHARVTR
jgi:tetratricopeptide (TPR) repeat protein